MGRRPNPLMAEFFQRGNKISNGSNRYEQTCKRCNEYFPKGRNESMVPHLTKKCPGINRQERARIIFRLHDLALPDLNPYIDPNYAPEVAQDTSQPENGNNNPQNQPGRPRAARTQDRNQDFDGLNVLAEASRRVGRDEREDAGIADGTVLDPQLEAGDLPGNTIARLPIHATAASFLPPSYTYETHLSSFSQDHLADHPLIDKDHADFSALATPEDMILAHGVMANMGMSKSSDVPGLRAQTQGHEFHKLNTEHFQVRSPGSSSPLTQSLLSSQTEPADEGSFLRTQAQTIMPLESGSLASQHFIPAPSNPSKPSTPLPEDSMAHFQDPKPRGRGKFVSDARREEVRKVRSLGACLRCRMLRKPCSKDTPCITCAPISNPRLYKVSCIRTKLDEEFPLYFTTPYTVLANHELNGLKEQAIVAAFEGVVEAFHFPGHKISFKANQLTMLTAADPVDFGIGLTPENEVIVLKLMSDDVLRKVERYLQEVTADVIGKETSPAMQASLQFAQVLKGQQEQGTILVKPDNLLSEVIELWVATVLITDTQLTAFFTVVPNNGTGSSLIDANANPVSDWMLKNQFRAAIEKRADTICKSVLHHFEKRVVFRNMGNNFETFLVAFLMLNCAERMYWLFRRWALPNAQFPLEGDPTTYADKAESFFQFIQMMFNMRRILEPKVMEDPQTGLLIASNPEDTALTAWLTVVGFTTDLTAHFGPGQFNPDDSRSLDGVFSGRIIQPTGTT